MNRSLKSFSTLLLVSLAASHALAQIQLIDSLPAGLSNRGIAFDPTTDHLVTCSDSEMLELDLSGQFVGNLDGPCGFDFDVTGVPAGSMGARTVVTTFGSFIRTFNLDDGSSSIVPGINSGNEQIARVTFDAGENQFIGFDGFFGRVYPVDVTGGRTVTQWFETSWSHQAFDILLASDTLYFGNQSQLFEIDKSGNELRTIDLAPLGLVGDIGGMSFDNDRGELWILGDNDVITRWGGFAAVPEPSSWTLLFGCLVFGFLPRRFLRAKSRSLKR